MYLQISEHQSIIPNCHLCGVQSSDLTSYLDNFSEAGHFIFLAIQKYLAIDVREKSICNNCGRKVEDWDSFYLKCHELQALFKQTENAATVISLTPIAAKHVVEEVSTDLNTNDIHNNFSNFVQELTQEKACADDTVLPQMIENPGPSFEDLPEEDENKSQSEQETEDEFEEITSEEEDQSGESSDESDEPSKPRKGRHKKFVFTIPFLERKLDRKFSPSERTKLQKFIRKRQNTSIYEMLVGGGPSQLWDCKICQKSLKGRAGEVARHYLRTHQVEPILPCHVCDYTSRTEKMYQAHRMSHLVEYPCEHCGRLFHQHSRLVTHLNSHNNEREFECMECGKKFNTSQYLTTHKRKVHGDQEKLLKYTCEQCGMRFKYKNHLLYHQKRHPTDENPLPYSCKYCEEHFMTRAEQLAHSNTVHAGEGDFVCHLCGKKMKTIMSLENHIKLHSGLKEFKCDQCGAAFATNHSLKCHRKIHDREKEDSQQFACHICHKSMSNKSSLNQHLKTHMDVKPYQCQHCDASFIHKNRLEVHMRKHTGDCPIRCVDCGKGFRSTSSMNSHRQYVHSERKFACGVCGKAFKTPRDLKVHATLHTGEKPNICGVCGKAFRVRANYFKHRKIHIRSAAAANEGNKGTAEEPTPEEECEDEEMQDHHIQRVVVNQDSVIPSASALPGVTDPQVPGTDFFQFATDSQWIT